MLADLLDEKRRDARRLIGLPARDDRFRLGGVRLRLRDVPLVGHALQHDVAPRCGALHVDERALPLRRLKDAGDEGRFLERELLVRLAEIHARRGFDAVRAVPQVHLVAVDREDLALRVPLLDLDRENQLLHLPLEGVGKGLLAFRREPELLLEIARELLRERAGALGPPHLDDVGQRGGADAPDVDAEMAVELRVFGGDDRLLQQRVDVVVADDDAPLGGELADQLVVDANRRG